MFKATQKEIRAIKTLKQTSIQSNYPVDQPKLPCGQAILLLLLSGPMAMNLPLVTLNVASMFSTLFHTSRLSTIFGVRRLAFRNTFECKI